MNFQLFYAVKSTEIAGVFFIHFVAQPRALS